MAADISFALLVMSYIVGLPCIVAEKSFLRMRSGTRVFGTGRWNLDRIFKDEPAGAYLDLLKPLTYASYLTYKTTEGERYDADGVWDDKLIGSKFKANATSPGALNGGNTWERLYEAEENPKQGTHMRAIVDHGAKRAILAFRGICLDPTYKSCKNDLCAAAMARTGAKLDVCGFVGKSLKGYMNMAAEDVRRTRKLLGPSYAIMLTGHSLGGLLALTVDALHNLDTQAVGLEPTPFGKVMANSLHLSVKDIGALDASRRYAIYDPNDLLSTSYGPLEELRPSTTVCVYKDTPLTSNCQECMDKHSSEISLAADVTSVKDAALRQCLGGSQMKLSKAYTDCKDSVHFLDHYIKDLIPSTNSDGSTTLPSCSVIGVSQKLAHH